VAVAAHKGGDRKLTDPEVMVKRDFLTFLLENCITEVG
jgi:hypothetical protein